MSPDQSAPTPQPFAFDRRGEIKGDPRGAHVVMAGRLGEVREQYRDEDETIRLRVTFFNGEPWPTDPPAGCVRYLPREATK